MPEIRRLFVNSHPGEKRGLRMLYFTFTQKYMYACINVLRKAAILVVDPIRIDNFALYFNCKLAEKISDSIESLLRQGLSEPEFYDDLVYKLKKIIGSNNFSTQFDKIIYQYKKMIGYNTNVLQQTACLVVNPITVGKIAFLGGSDFGLYDDCDFKTYLFMRF